MEEGRKGCSGGFVTLCNMLNWILMNCVCGMMLRAAAFVPLFRLYDEADVRLDCAARARTPCDPSRRRASQRVTAPRRRGWVAIIRRIRGGRAFC